MGAKSSKNRPSARVLTLGCAQQGKSTFHKQMRLLFNGSWTEEERLTYGRTLSQCITVGLTHIVDHCQENKIPLSRKSTKIADWLMEQNAHTLEITPEIADSLKTLWYCEKFQEGHKNSGKFEFTESLEYGMKHLTRLMETNWRLNDDDILIARQRTTGLSTTEFTAYRTDFTMVDVGGDTIERRKWVHAEREPYDAIIFFCSLDDFDAPAVGFKGTKLEESLAVWEEVMMHQVEPIRPIVVFFNKKDRFAEKIKTVSARKYIKTYKGLDGDYKSIVRHIANLFMKGLKKSPIERRGVYMKTTCMTDSKTMEYIFKSFYDFMIQRSLQMSQLSRSPKVKPKRSSSSMSSVESQKKKGRKRFGSFASASGKDASWASDQIASSAENDDV